jgi:hypothetical protein
VLNAIRKWSFPEDWLNGKIKMKNKTKESILFWFIIIIITLGTIALVALALRALELI